MKKRPIVLCIMDGYGISESINGNAVRLANTPNLDDLMAMYPAGVSKKDAMGYVYDDFLGPSEPNNGKGRR